MFRALVGILALLAAGCGGASGGAAPEEGGYPTRVVMLATHSSPGGGSDVFLREMAPHLARILGVSVVVENLQGGSGARALNVLAKAKPDGGLFYATTPTMVYTSLLSKPAATYRDLEPIVNIFYDPEVLYTAADSSFASLQDVIAHARARGGRWGAANPASLERQVLEQLKQRAGVNPAVATFEGGGDMMINVLNHTLDIGVGELQEIRSQLDAGRLRLLGVAGEERLPQFPDVPTVKEQGIDLAVRKFRGLAGPKGTPREVVEMWEAAIPQLLADPKYKEIYTQNSLLPGFLPHGEYVEFVDAFGRETEAFLKGSGVIR
jgi:tripartite-type tricarboxylate transporter receptor subunit TctC